MTLLCSEHYSISWSLSRREQLISVYKTEKPQKIDYYAVRIIYRLLFISMYIYFYELTQESPNPVICSNNLCLICASCYQFRFECAVRHNCIIIVVTNTCPDFIIRGDKLHPQGLYNRSFSTGFWLESDVISQILDIYWLWTSVVSNLFDPFVKSNDSSFSVISFIGLYVVVYFLFNHPSTHWFF